MAEPNYAFDGTWVGEQEISESGMAVRKRAYLFPGFLFRGSVATDRLDHAKITLENLIAIQKAS